MRACWNPELYVFSLLLLLKRAEAHLKKAKTKPSHGVAALDVHRI